MTNFSAERQTDNVLGAHIDALTWDAALARLLAGRARDSRYVTICNVHGPEVMWIDACMAG